MPPFLFSQISLHCAVQRHQVLIHKFQDKDNPGKAYKIPRAHKNLQELGNNKLLLQRMCSRKKFKLLFCRPLKYGATNGDSKGLVRDKLASCMICGQEHHVWLHTVTSENYQSNVIQWHSEKKPSEHIWTSSPLNTQVKKKNNTKLCYIPPSQYMLCPESALVLHMLGFRSMC